MLLGRTRERQAIDHALSKARSGQSATLGLIGEAGIGKTALLDYAAGQTADMQMLRARGVQSEAQIPFGSLLELLRPALIMLDRIPTPQAVALESALALRPPEAQERFAVGAATLSLLAAYAELGSLAVLIDDAHWLDDASSEALLFAVRRLVADPIAVVVSVRAEEPSLLDGSDLPTLRLGGLTHEEAAKLLPDVPSELAMRLCESTGGNPLAMLELAPEAEELELAPAGAPVLVPTKISRAFLRRAEPLEDSVRSALVLAAASDSGDLRTLERAAAKLDIQVSTLASAEAAGLVKVRGGEVEFRHPLARSALYAQAPPEQRRAAHRALAAALPDKDVDRRAWHLAAASVGTDDAAARALEQAAARARQRSAYANAAAAFERAARLSDDPERQADLLWQAADSAWLAGLGDRADRLLEDARALTETPALAVQIENLSGHIAMRRGPVMRGHAILAAAAAQADPETAVVMLAEAAGACLIAADAIEMLRTAQRATLALPADASARARYLAAMASGMAQVLGSDAQVGAELIHEAVRIARAAPELQEDPQLRPWLVLAPLYLRDRRTGRELIEQALDAARARAAVGALPFLLNLVARDDATTDRWAIAQATHIEGIQLAQESGQLTELAFGLADLAMLHARSGREQECRDLASQALSLSRELGLGLYEIWATAALGELELGLGRASAAAEHFERQLGLLQRSAVTDVDLSPAAELVDAYVRLGERDRAEPIVDSFEAAAQTKGQPWALARSLRCRALLAGENDLADRFERALEVHEQTRDAFETARTRLAYGERLRRMRQRIRAREQLRIALESFEALGAKPWAERARSELAASGERLRRRDPTSVEELTPQELQIALLLAEGKTTREAATALFLSPKTIEYHLRHVYQKLDIGSRGELAGCLAAQMQARDQALAAST
jgi:DNA-binding CsgD family transcriptional regulator